MAHVPRPLDGSCDRRIVVCDDPECEPCRRFSTTVYDRPSQLLDLLDRTGLAPELARTDIVFLDADRCGVGVLTVTDTDEPEAVLGVAETVSDGLRGTTLVDAVVVASHRPHGGATLDDLERWLELDAMFHDVGVELVEWFVLGVGGVGRPRELVGEAERWAA